MKVVSSWVKESLCRTMLNDTEIAQALERSGMEVEQISTSFEIDDHVIVGLVKKVVQHPGADKLKLAEVETGEGKYGVVCGAPNVRVGLKVAFAQIGTTLPGGEKISRVKLRGEVSEGMICSEFELGLGNDHNGILELSNVAVVGTPLRELFPADTVIDLTTPANRWDVQSVYGLAREVAAMTEADLVPLTPPLVNIELSSGAKGGLLAARIEAKRYALARLRVPKGAKSPRLVEARLRAAGGRSIDHVVDVTNYVLHEVGQPLHAFDAAKVVPPIAVRHAKPGERLQTLDGVKRELTASDLVIADATGPIALAGLMGGAGTEVSGDTSEILLEAAVFDAVTVRKMAQRHGLRTEASAHFERDIPAALPPLGLARAIEMLTAGGGELLEAVEAPYQETKSWNIALPLSVLQTMLGFGISHKEAVGALAKLGIEAHVKDFGEKHKQDTSGLGIEVAAVPWWRPDLREPADLVEEIVRVVGYDRVPSTIPSWRPKRIEFDRVRAVRRQVRDILWAAGAFEVMTYSFVSTRQLAAYGLEPKAHLKLKNPLSLEQAYMRSSLLPSHMTVLERNRMYGNAVKLYEISNVFVKRGSGELPDEPLRLGVTVLEPEGGYAVAKGLLDAVSDGLGVDVDIRPAANEAYAPGRYGEVWLAKTQIGGIGQLPPGRVRQMKLAGDAAHFELELTPLMAASRTRAYEAVSSYPSIQRDLALLLPADATWQAVRDTASGWEVEFVDDYYGEGLPAGTKGLTIRLTLSLPDRTPTEAEAVELEEAILARLSHKLGAKRRT